MTSLSILPSHLQTSQTAQGLPDWLQTSRPPCKQSRCVGRASFLQAEGESCILLLLLPVRGNPKTPWGPCLTHQHCTSPAHGVLPKLFQLLGCPTGRGEIATQLPRQRGRWEPLCPSKPTTVGCSHTRPADWYYISICPGKGHQASPGLWGERDTWVPESRGWVMELTWMKAAIRSTMRQTRWPGFKANDCRWEVRKARKAEGAAQQEVTWHRAVTQAKLRVHSVVGRRDAHPGSTTALWESRCRAYNSL